MKLENFLICDDIRQELGGKFSLMGIYQRDCNFPFVPEKWPYLMRLSFLLRLTVEEAKDKRYNSLLFESISDGKITNSLVSELTPLADNDDRQMLVVAFLVNNFRIDAPGANTFVATLRSNDDEEQIQLGKLHFNFLPHKS